ncbi:MAG: hypothetical protein ACYTAF_05005 [Planctomycetota bacterium]|jgi:hypothetical protein
MDVFDRISKGFGDFVGAQPSLFFLLLIILGVAVLLAMIVYSVLVQRRRAPAKPAPLTRVLFPRLCRENGLTRAEAKILQRMAESYQIPDAALLFFRRSLFESGATTLGLDAETTEALRQKLYGP